MYPYHLFALIFLIPSICGLGTSLGENVALRKSVFGGGRTKAQLVDGNRQTNYEPDSSFFSYFYVDLGAVYNLSTVHLYSRSNNPRAGFSETFSLYTWNRHASACAFRDYYPWHLVQAGLKFNQTSQQLVVQPKKPAQYIIVVTDIKQLGKPVAGVKLSELEAYGTKLRDSPVPQPPKDEEPEPDHYSKTRQEIIGKQTILRVQQNYGQWIPNATLKDVAFGWHHDRINAMATERGKGRIVVMLGTQIINLLQTDERYTSLNETLKRWLGNGSEGGQFVPVNKNFKPGDILIITRSEQFDVEQVYNKIVTGENPAFIGYLSQITPSQDKATELLEKLNIKLLRHSGRYMPRDINLQAIVNSSAYDPPVYRLERAARYWRIFKSERLSTRYGPKDLQSPEFQNALQLIVKNFGPYLAEIAPCEFKAYTKSDDTKIALENYNDALLIQYNQTVTRLPGFSVNPGDVDPSVKPESYTVTLNVDVAGSFFPVGGYAKAGKAFRWKVINTTAPNLDNFRIRINAQTDYIGGHSTWRRWPRVSQNIQLTKEGFWASPHGGPIYLTIPAQTNITIRFEKVYRYAWLDLRDNATIEKWYNESRSRAGVPWLTIMGDMMYSQMPTIKLLSTPTEGFVFAVNFYDNVIKMMHNYRGTAFEKARAEVMSLDIQISAGAAHAGYPWQGSMYWVSGVTYIDDLKQGKMIGYVHEIGHNLQPGAATLRGGIEVTNNVYILLTYDHLLKLPMYDIGHRPGLTHGDLKDMVNRWKANKYHGPTLTYYAMLGRMFGEGLVGNLYTKAMNASRELNTEQKKTQFWLRNLCEETGYNMLPYHQLWDFPIESDTLAACSNYPCYFPNDTWTQQVPEKVNIILNGTTCQSNNTKKVVFRGDLMRGVNQRGKKFVFFHKKGRK